MVAEEDISPGANGLRAICLTDLYHSNVHEIMEVKHFSNSYANKWVDIFQGVAKA